MDTRKIDHHIGRLLARLSKLQKPDGSWGDNNFVTGLVACSLAEIHSDGNNGRGRPLQNPKIKTMFRKTLRHILSEKSEGWSWNYYPRRSNGHVDSNNSDQKYPDDLDDTSVALIFLIKMRADADISGSIDIDDRVFTHIAQLLMNAEMREGGPYNTWIVKNRKDLHWRDVDPGVNANISYFLSLSDIALPRLTSYLDRTIRKNRYGSKYYHNPLVVMYFMSRGYSGKEKERLVRHVEKERMLGASRASAADADIFTAILSACIYMNLGEPAEKISPHIERVMKFCNARCRKGSKNCGVFPAPALYMEKKCKNSPSGNSDIIHARSEAVFAALCAEMFSAYRVCLIRDDKKRKEDLVHSTIVREAEKILKSLPAAMRRDGHRLLSQTLAHDKNRTITLLPARMAHRNIRATRKSPNISFETIVHCGLISLYGWITYTIYDDMLDGENLRPEHIPIANIFHREMIALIAHMPPDVQSFFRHIMNILDSAEYAECRNRISDGRTCTAPGRSPSSLSNNVWRKSAGCIFPSACIMMHAGHALGSLMTKKLVQFFRHYLSAKQIADDIRDWEEDVSRGIVTPVTALISKACPGDPDDGEKFEKRFLEHALGPSAREVLRHAIAAQKILASRTMRRNFSDTMFLAELVKPHEKAARATLDKLKAAGNVAVTDARDQTIYKS